MCPNNRPVEMNVLLFMQMNEVDIFHVLHDRENYLLRYWYCTDADDASNLIGETHFDVRALPKPFLSDLVIEVRIAGWKSPSDILVESQKSATAERLSHREAIKRAVEAEHNFGAWQKQVTARETAHWEANRATQPAFPDDDKPPF